MKDLVPAHKGIFEGTPVRHRQVVLLYLRKVFILVAPIQVVNDEFLNHVREGRCVYIRGDTKRFTPGGVLVNVRSRESKPKERGEEVSSFRDYLMGAAPTDGGITTSFGAERVQRRHYRARHWL